MPTLPGCPSQSCCRCFECGSSLRAPSYRSLLRCPDSSCPQPPTARSAILANSAWVRSTALSSPMPLTDGAELQCGPPAPTKVWASTSLAFRGGSSKDHLTTSTVISSQHLSRYYDFGTTHLITPTSLNTPFGGCRNLARSLLGRNFFIARRESCTRVAEENG